MPPKYHEGITLSLKSAYFLGVHQLYSSKSQFLLFMLAFVASLTHLTLTAEYLLVEFNNESLGMDKILLSYEAASGIVHGLIKLLALHFNRDKFALLINKSLKFWDLNTHHEKELIADCNAYNKFIMTMLHSFIAVCAVSLISYNGEALFFVLSVLEYIMLLCSRFTDESGSLLLHGTQSVGCLMPLFVQSRTPIGIVSYGDDIAFLLPIYKPSYIPRFVIFLGQNYVILVICVAITAHDGILISCIIMVKVQFKLLNNKLGKLFVEQTHILDVNKEIKKCVDHHNYILQFVDQSNKTVSITLVFCLGHVILAMCVEFYTVSKQISLEITFRALCYIAAILFQLFSFYCVPGQLLADEAEETSSVVFYNHWEDMSSPSIMCAIKMIIQASQRPVLILAGGILPINLDSGKATLQTITSYYMFLSTMTEDVE